MGKQPGKRFEEIALDAIEVPDVVLRSVASEKKMEELRLSIKEKGVLEPVVVEETEAGYRLIVGSRRVIAADAAGLVTIPAMVVQADEEWKVWATMAENRIREDINAYDEARYIAAVIERQGKSQAEVAQLLGVSTTWVSKRLAILTWPDEMKGALVQGMVSYAVCRELVGIQDEARRKAAVSQAIVSGCTARQAADWRRAWEREQVPAGLVSEGALAGAEGPGARGLPGRCGLCGERLSPEDSHLLEVCGHCLVKVEG